MKRFVLRRLLSALCASGLIGLSTQAIASGFQLWEQDGASIGNYHAGYAVGNDASTAFYNPAGITRFKNPQVVLGAVAITADFKFRGNVIVTENTFPKTFPSVTAQGGTFNLVPDFHFVTPITDWLGFGFSVDVPFGLKTDYGRSSPLRYAATLTSITVVDVSPSLGIKVTDKGSIGAGLDIQKAEAQFDSVGVFLFALPDVQTDTPSTNKATGTGYGFHAGVLYEFCPQSRIGLSYHSQVVHHLSGTSKFVGPIADIFNDDRAIVSNRATTRLTLPPYTALSGYQVVNPKWALLATVIYTQWSTFKTLSLNNFAGLAQPEFSPEPSTSIAVNITENYRNTWNVSIGTEYYLNDQITLRGGIGWDQTPVRQAFRNVQLPDQDRYIFALGGHYQASRALGFDLGWAHLFINQAHLNPPPQVMGAQSVQTPGNVKGGADVFGAQVTWNIC